MKGRIPCDACILIHLLLSWIHSLARIDPGLLQLLRYARQGEWVYGQVPATEHARQLGPALCRGVGLPSELGMPDKVRSRINLPFTSEI